MNEKQLTKQSKFLSLVLRHKPEEIGIVLDNEGWTDVAILLEKTKMSLEDLKYIVDTNSKKRFAFNSDFSKIRANQGHSVEVDLKYETKTPPEKLYHGTAIKNVNSILQTGLEKRQRHHVHLSQYYTTALEVGQRYGEPIVLTVLAKLMFDEGHSFYLSENNVWLTDHVPAKYIRYTIQ